MSLPCCMSADGQNDNILQTEVKCRGISVNSDNAFQMELLQEQWRLLRHSVDEQTKRLEAISRTVQDHAVSLDKGKAVATSIEKSFGQFCQETREHLTMLDRNLTGEVSNTTALTQASIEELVACEVKSRDDRHKAFDDSLREDLRNLRESVKEELRSLRVYVLQEGLAREKAAREQCFRYVVKMLEEEKEARKDDGRKLESWVAQQEAARRVAAAFTIHSEVANADVFHHPEDCVWSSETATPRMLSGHNGDLTSAIGNTQELGIQDSCCVETTLETSPPATGFVAGHEKSIASSVETTVPTTGALLGMSGGLREVEEETNVVTMVATPRLSPSSRCSALVARVGEVVFAPSRQSRPSQNVSGAVVVNPPLQQTHQQQQVQPQHQLQQQQPQPLQQLQHTQQPVHREVSPSRQAFSVQYPVAGSTGSHASVPVQRLSSCSMQLPSPRTGTRCHAPSSAASPPTPSCAMSPRCGSPRGLLLSADPKPHPRCGSPAPVVLTSESQTRPRRSQSAQRRLPLGLLSPRQSLKVVQQPVSMPNSRFPSGSFPPAAPSSTDAWIMTKAVAA